MMIAHRVAGGVRVTAALVANHLVRLLDGRGRLVGGHLVMMVMMQRHGCRDHRVLVDARVERVVEAGVEIALGD